MNTLNQFAQWWWAWMTAMTWQVVLLITIIFGLDLLIRRWIWPQVRYALWLMVLIKLVMPPHCSSQHQSGDPDTTAYAELRGSGTADRYQRAHNPFYNRTSCPRWAYGLIENVRRSCIS